MAERGRPGVLREFWRPHVLAVAAELPETEQRRPAAILDALSQDMAKNPERWEKLAAGELPSEHTVGRILRDPDGRLRPPHRDTVGRILGETTDEELRQYRFVHWPGSFESGALPWEAAPVVAEFLRRTNPDYNWNIRRPPVRYALAFWRATVSAPDAPFETRCAIADLLAPALLLRDPSRAALLAEWAIVCHPWDRRSGIYMTDFWHLTEGWLGTELATVLRSAVNAWEQTVGQMEWSERDRMVRVTILERAFSPGVARAIFDLFNFGGDADKGARGDGNA